MDNSICLRGSCFPSQSGVYSFAPMKGGVTSTTLADHSAPREIFSTSSHLGDFRNIHCSQPLTLPQEYNAGTKPNHLSWTYPSNPDSDIFYRRHVTPKVFSPILLYQRPPDLNTQLCHINDQRVAALTDSQRQTIPQVESARCAVSLTQCFEDMGQDVNSKTDWTRVSSSSHVDWMTKSREEKTRCLGMTGGESAFQVWKSQRTEDLTHGYTKLCRKYSHFASNENTDSANLKFFLDTKYGLDNSDTYCYPEFSLSSNISPALQTDAKLADRYLSTLPELNDSLDSDDLDKKSRKYKCPYCQVACANNGQLRGHLRVHTGEKPFRCDYDDCGRAFARNEELTRHRRIHSGVRPHTCATCGKMFGRKDHLNKHVKTHLKTADKKVHVCNVADCEQRYTRSDALARHQWSAHGIKSKTSRLRTQPLERMTVYQQ